MLTRIEIDGFKTFERFGLDLSPLTAIVGPNASGKSNLFDALQLLSALAEKDIRSAMKGLRGEPEEFFRQTASGTTDCIAFAVEVFLPKKGVDEFGREFEITAQRLRYEVKLGLNDGRNGEPKGIFVRHEYCCAMLRAKDKADYLQPLRPKYNSRVNPFIQATPERDALLVRQDGRQRHGRPVQLSLKEASRTALSTVTTAEFTHLYALREMLLSLRFLEINPTAARAANDRYELTVLRPDASNLAAVLTSLKEETATSERPDGVLADIAADLASLIPSVSRIETIRDPLQRQYSFSLGFADDLSFSARVISDGTLRLLALLAVLDDPNRKGTLCFEEPENGVHEGRIPILVEFLRDATVIDPASESPLFQIILNTHSPKVMAALQDSEIVAADMVVAVQPGEKLRTVRTRMRRGIAVSSDLFDPELHLVRAEIERLLQRQVDAL
jgi:predicted ATPase